MYSGLPSSHEGVKLSRKDHHTGHHIYSLTPCSQADSPWSSLGPCPLGLLLELGLSSISPFEIEGMKMKEGCFLLFFVAGY